MLAHCETGFMRMVEDGTRDVRRLDRDEAGADELAGARGFRLVGRWLAGVMSPSCAPWSLNDGHGERDPEDIYCRFAEMQLEMMAYQLGYPPDAAIGGCTVQTYRDVLGWLIARALQARDRGEEATPRSEQALVAAIASALAVDPAVIGQAVAAFTLDRESAAYHAAVPGIAAAPLVRVDRTGSFGRSTG